METYEPDIKLNVQPEFLTPDHVRGLSLHDVTQQYETLGLHLKLLDSLHRHELDKNTEVMWAVNFGLMLHANDKRSNGQYGDHLMRVTLRVIEKFGITDPAIIAACMLHDSVEDHPFEIPLILAGEIIEDEHIARARSLELITFFTNDEIAEIVYTVSNPILQPGEDKQLAYDRHTEHLVVTSQKGRIVKLADFIDNAVGNHYTRKDKQLRLDKKYIGQYRYHMLGLFLPDSIMPLDKRDDIARQLQKGQARALYRLSQAA